MEPVTITALATIIGILVLAFTDPAGSINQFICFLIDIVSAPFPPTPDYLKLSFIINSLSSFMPIFGKSLIESIIGTIRDLFILYSVIKIYKLIPFKAT